MHTGEGKCPRLAHGPKGLVSLWLNVAKGILIYCLRRSIQKRWCILQVWKTVKIIHFFPYSTKSFLLREIDLKEFSFAITWLVFNEKRIYFDRRLYPSVFLIPPVPNPGCSVFKFDFKYNTGFLSTACLRSSFQKNNNETNNYNQRPKCTKGY